MDDLDEWTTAEKLALAIFVKREGSQNWGLISRVLKSHAADIIKFNRPSDWYNAKFCALQYNSLFNEMENLKKKRGERGEETTIDLIVKVLREKRKNEMIKSLYYYKELFKTYDLINKMPNKKDPKIMEEVFDAFKKLKQINKNIQEERKRIEENGFAGRRRRQTEFANKSENLQKEVKTEIVEETIETNVMENKSSTPPPPTTTMEIDNINLLSKENSSDDPAPIPEVDMVEEKIINENINENEQKSEIMNQTETIKIELNNNENNETVENNVTIVEENETIESTVTLDKDETGNDKIDQNKVIEIKITPEIKAEHNDEEVINITTSINNSVNESKSNDQESLELKRINLADSGSKRKKRRHKNVSSIIKTRSNRSIVKNETSETSTTEDERKEPSIKDIIKCEISEESNQSKILKVESHLDLKENKKAVITLLREANLNLGPTLSLINHKNPFFYETMDLITLKRKVENDEISSEEFEDEISNLIENIFLKYDILGDDIDLVDYAIDAFEKLEEIKEGL